MCRPIGSPVDLQSAHCGGCVLVSLAQWTTSGAMWVVSGLLRAGLWLSREGEGREEGGVCIFAAIPAGKQYLCDGIYKRKSIVYTRCFSSQKQTPPSLPPPLPPSTSPLHPLVDPQRSAGVRRT